MQELHTLPELINTFAGRGEHPVILALQKEGMTCWTYAELGDHVQRLANGFAHAGLSQGDRVALLAGYGPAPASTSTAPSRPSSTRYCSGLSGCHSKRARSNHCTCTVSPDSLVY